jgi:N-acetylmuramoyl-L-alanine amidase
MGKLKYLVIHCTDTPEERAVTKDDIIRWHTNPRHKGGRGWNRPGYSDIIYLDGELINIIPFNQDNDVDSWEISNGVRGINGVSRHIVYVGGLDKGSKKPKDTRTDGQKQTLETYVKFMLLRHPQLQVLGHKEAPEANKACPCFDVAKWLKSIGVADKNIYKS